VEDHLLIDEELELFSGVSGHQLNPSGNQNLFMKRNEMILRDDFSHEQNLIISEAGNTLLLAGCAHNGIVNIINHYRSIKNSTPDYVIGGFHLYSRTTEVNEDPETVRKIGEYLIKTGSTYYTCHCTGLESFRILKEMMPDRMSYLATGSRLII
jgi:7,8-dihydropterin-6-yl-methyl-4-(beta-D-ribofuranosyl)aminobenzene 5'-phosphate synthase